MNRKKFLATLAIALLLPTVGMAQERGTKEEAKALVDAALAHFKKVGMEQAFKDFQNDKAKWIKKDLYIFAYDLNGTNLVFGTNEKIVGKNLLELKDPDGKFVVKEMIALVTSPKGGGWVDYEWVNPTTKKYESKQSYVVKLPQFDGYVGTGIYK